MRGLRAMAAVAALLGLALAGCAVVAPTAANPQGSAAPSATQTTPTQALSATSAATAATAAPTPSGAKTPTPTPTPSRAAEPLAGMVIVVDPGHNGKYKASFNTKKVPAGNGKKKACNSSGTATNSGYSEHAYNWAQAKELKKQLEKLGAEIILTRQNDSGLGPCVNIRAGTANKAKADLLISIHADGSYAKGARGFHVIVSTTMAGGSKLEAQSVKLAKYARDALLKLTKMPRSTYTAKSDGLSRRSDIATLNLLKTTPGIMMEMGNMRNSKDAKLLKSATFRKQAATALAQAAVKLLAPESR